MSILATTFAAELKQVLRERNLSVTEAARQLGLSRQAIYNYLNGIAVPRDKIIERAMILWDLKMSIGRMTFDRTSFPKSVQLSVTPTQLNLWEKLESIRQKDLKIGVERVGDAFEISVQISIPA
jgi:transcriptional regulator with XRE-family HTH domain